MYNSPYGMGNTMPTSTQPYGYPMMPYMNNGMTNTPPQPNSPINTNKIYVSGIEDVRTRLIPPNSEMIFIDNEKDIIYEKKVDNKGQFEVKAFNISPYQAPEGNNESKVDMSDYVKTNELQNLQNKIANLEEQISKLAPSREVTESGTGTISHGTSL